MHDLVYNTGSAMLSIYKALRIQSTTLAERFEQCSGRAPQDPSISYRFKNDTGVVYAECTSKTPH